LIRVGASGTGGDGSTEATARGAARYIEVLARLYAARRAGIVFGLERIRRVLDRLDGPDRQLGAVVHVGGTNGKGSTVAMIAAVARTSGARVATYTSPHLASLTERIAVDGVPIREEAVAEVAERVWSAGGAELTFFEQVTAIGLVHLAQCAPDVTVLEVGLGGRLDATNTVDAPIAVVTGVALDHQEYLGDTLDAIAREKAGIWKRGQAAIIGASGEPDAIPVLVDAARRAGVARLTMVSDGDIAAVPPLGLVGTHQRANAAAALAAVHELVVAGVLRVDSATTARALAAVVHPGRFETVALSPRIVLDGAHNPHAARALARTIRDLPGPRILVLGVSADKDAEGMVRALLPAVDHTIATAYSQPRALDAHVLRAIVGAAGGSVVAQVGVGAALGLARSLAGEAGSVVITGSLYLVGEVRAALLGGRVDPFVVSDPTGIGGP